MNTTQQTDGLPLVLQDRRDELEGLDLAIERQKHNLQEMKAEERWLMRDKHDARTELENLRKRNDRKLIVRYQFCGQVHEPDNPYFFKKKNEIK